MNELLNLQAVRARKARLGRRLGHGFAPVLALVGGIGLVGGAILWLLPSALAVHGAYLLAGAGVGCMLAALWYQGDILHLPATRSDKLDERLSANVLGQLYPGQALTPQGMWQLLAKHWQSRFLANHLLLGDVQQLLSTQEADMAIVWPEAIRLADTTGLTAVEVGHVAAALLQTSPGVLALLTQAKALPDEIMQVLTWECRIIEMLQAPKPYFGGIARDWTNGFTPTLNQYGQNVSLAIERYGAHYTWLMASPGVQTMKSAFAQHASAVALIGDPGVGKTSHVYALAQALLQENNDPLLAHNQIISLNPSFILANAHTAGQLEAILLLLIQEAVHAGHIILFLDDAHLFFKEGVGTFDITKVLLSAIQSHGVRLVLAMTPQDYQQLQATNASFVSMLTPVVVNEPPEADVIRVLEDTATGLEARHKVIVSYEALHEAYRLSGRYDQDVAYPGRAIRLLEQALTHATNNVVTSVSVQTAVEQSRGVRVAAAKPAEADQLIHLEDAIHQRMINQSRAVSVVANALRRARAGVSNPNRPIGSFLFLGPTGVGKTELARSIAATYFGAESNMIRLDMSEYQRPEDVGRLLASGDTEHASLIMAVRRQPFSVVLLDEIEKAHPNILNLLLQLLDEGKLTDAAGRAASFKDAIVIATSNAGANTIRERVGRGEELAAFEQAFIDELIGSGQFKPELLNRFDEIVLFRPLKMEELIQLVSLMLGEVNRTLATQNISVALTPAAAQQIVEAGYDPRLGARPLRRALQRAVEDTIANRILSGQTKPGDHVVLDVNDLMPAPTVN